MRVRDKVAIITGAGSGIGREAALLFAQEGAKVVVADMMEKAGCETVELIGGSALFVKVDVSDWDDVARLIGETVAHFGRVDILFNNAGINIAQRLPVVELAEDDWDRVMAINLKGVFLGIRHALPIMMQQRYGVIVNTSSIAGLSASQRQAAYCASKAGVLSLTRQIAVDYGPWGIRANCVCPGTLPKPTAAVHEFFLRTPGALERRNELMAQRAPLKMLCTNADVAYAALYLASDESSHVTGAALSVDGGLAAL